MVSLHQFHCINLIKLIFLLNLDFRTTFLVGTQAFKLFQIQKIRENQRVLKQLLFVTQSVIVVVSITLIALMSIYTPKQVDENAPIDV